MSNIRRWLYVVLITLLIAGCSQNESGKYDETVTYLDHVYQKIQTEQFISGEILDDKVVLKDADTNVVKEVSVETSKKEVSVESILREGDSIYFLLGGSVDDHYGIVYVPTNVVNMEGPWVVKRISGNAYYYSTARE